MKINRLGSVDPVSDVNKLNKGSKAAKKESSDSISLSKEARESAELLRAAEIVRDAPDIRMDRVEEVKAKLQDPNYINDTVVDSVATSILDLFGI